MQGICGCMIVIALAAAMPVMMTMTRTVVEPRPCRIAHQCCGAPLVPHLYPAEFRLMEGKHRQASRARQWRWFEDAGDFVHQHASEQNGK